MKRGSFLELEDPKEPGWEEEGSMVVPDPFLEGRLPFRDPSD